MHELTINALYRLPFPELAAQELKLEAIYKWGQAQAIRAQVSYIKRIATSYEAPARVREHLVGWAKPSKPLCSSCHSIISRTSEADGSDSCTRIPRLSTVLVLRTQPRSKPQPTSYPTCYRSGDRAQPYSALLGIQMRPGVTSRWTMSSSTRTIHSSGRASPPSSSTTTGV